MCCCFPCCCCCCIPTTYRFAISIGVATFFTVLAVFTPGWGYLDLGCDNFKDTWDYLNGDVNGVTIGLITNRHGIPLFSFEKFCAAAMFLTLITDVAIFVMIMMFFFNLKYNYMPQIMVLLSCIGTFWLLLVAIIFGAKFHSTYSSKFGNLCTEVENDLYGNDDISFTPSYSYGGAVWALICSIIANIYGFVLLNEIYMWRDFSNMGQNQGGWGFGNRGNQNQNQNMNQGNNWNNGNNMNMSQMNYNNGNPNMGPGYNNMGYNGGNPNQGNWNGPNPMWNNGPNPNMNQGGGGNWNGPNPNMNQGGGGNWNGPNQNMNQGGGNWNAGNPNMIPPNVGNMGKDDQNVNGSNPV